MSTINILGPVGYNPTGNYDPTRTYEKLDVVYYQGSSYVAISDSIGQLPTNSEYWNCIAAGSLKQFVYDSVASMKADNTLSEGMYTSTVGYYEPNDGGAATYKITSEESETEYQEELENGLYATLIKTEIINPIIFGAKGDGITDDSLVLQTAIETAEAYNVVLDGLNKEYIVSDAVVLPSAISSNEKGLFITNNLNLKNFKFKLKDYVTALTSILNIANPINTTVKIENCIINGNRLNQNSMTGAQDGGCHGIRVGFPLMETHGSFIINNCIIKSCYSDNIVVRPFDYPTMLISNCTIRDAGRNGITDNSINSLIENCTFIDNGRVKAPKSSYHIEPDETINFGVKTIKDCKISGSGITGIALYFNTNTYSLNKLNILNCKCDVLNISGICTNESHIKEINIIDSSFTDVFTIGKGNLTTLLTYDNIVIQNVKCSNRCRIAGNTGPITEENLTIPNTTNVLIDNIEMKYDIMLNYNFNDVKIINSKFIKDSQATIDEEVSAAILPSGGQNNDYTYSINNLLIKNNYEKNYYRFIDNATIGTLRQLKNINNLIISSNTIEQDGGRLIRDNGTHNNIIFNDNISYNNANSITSPQFYFASVSNLIGSGNISNFNTNRGFDTSQATRYFIENNLFADTVVS